jgi:hypothetical protein
MDKQFYRIEELCAMMDVTRSYLKQLRNDGGGPPFMQPTPHVTRYPIEEYHEWVSEKVAEPKRSNIG